MLGSYFVESYCSGPVGIFACGQALGQFHAMGQSISETAVTRSRAQTICVPGILMTALKDEQLVISPLRRGKAIQCGHWGLCRVCAGRMDTTRQLHLVHLGVARNPPRNSSAASFTLLPALINLKSHTHSLSRTGELLLTRARGHATEPERERVYWKGRPHNGGPGRPETGFL